jgi:hypothetical protein
LFTTKNNGVIIINATIPEPEIGRMLILPNLKFIEKTNPIDKYRETNIE